MSDRLFESRGESCGTERVLVTTLSVAVYDRGLEPDYHRDQSLFGPWSRYEAELVDFAAARGSGASPWEAVRRLVGNHRTLLERRWSAGGPAS